MRYIDLSAGALAVLTPAASNLGRFLNRSSTDVNTLMRADFQLITLGRLALLPPAGADDAGLNRQRRKLAVLAVLALAREPVPRDVLLDMFWGDQDEERARHSLSDALSHLRRALGAAAISTRHAEVTLAGDTPLRVDVRELADAVRAGEHERALRLYGGGFLDAVYVGGSPRFEQWVELEARQVERLIGVTRRGRCAELAGSRAWAECERVAHRWLHDDPVSTDAAVWLLTAVRADGGREAELRALDEYEAYRTRLAREYGVEPDPAVAAFARSIPSRPDASEPLDTRLSVATVIHVPAPPTSSEPAVAAARETPRADGGRARHVLLFAAAAGALALAVLPATLLRSATESSPATVAIFPFEVRGGAEYGYLREGMVDLLSTNLDGTTGLRTVDARAVLAAVNAEGGPVSSPERGRDLAHRLGAAAYVLGDIVEAGGRLRVAAAFYDVERGAEPVSRAYAEGHADSLFAVVDGLTVALLAERAQQLGGRLVRTAALTTRSVPALKAYLEGERHWRALRLVEAVDALRRATRQDSTFALAWYRLGMASSWDARVDVAVDAMARALQYSAGLSERDRTLIAAYHDITQRNPEQAERRYRAVVADYPADVEAWAGIGEITFHGNPWRGGTFEESRAAWEHVLRLEPHNVGATWHLAYVSARQGRRAELDTLTRRIQATVAGGADLSIRAIRAVTLGGRDAQQSVLDDLADADDFALILAVWRVAVATDDVEAILRFSSLLVQPQRPPEVRALGHTLQTYLRLARGQVRAAGRELDALARLDPVMAHVHRGLVAAYPLGRTAPDSLVAFRERLRSAQGPFPRVTSSADLWVNVHAELRDQLRTYAIGLLSARLGDSRQAERCAALLELGTGRTEAGDLARSQARDIRAELLHRQGRAPEALAILESAREVVDFGSARASPFYARSRQRFLRAELLHGAGRDEEAAGWYHGIGEIFPYDVAYLAPAYLRRADILATQGEHAAAAVLYQRFLALWRASDPELQTWSAHAQRRIDQIAAQGRSAQARR